MERRKRARVTTAPGGQLGEPVADGAARSAGPTPPRRRWPAPPPPAPARHSPFLVPAFIATAPPMLPGMPARNSAPTQRRVLHDVDQPGDGRAGAQRHRPALGAPHRPPRRRGRAGSLRVMPGMPRSPPGCSLRRRGRAPGCLRARPGEHRHQGAGRPRTHQQLGGAADADAGPGSEGSSGAGVDLEVGHQAGRRCSGGCGHVHR